jgi:uncharacterized protein YecT (DUF1311 family)
LIIAVSDDAPGCAKTETQLDLNECAGRAFEEADAKMNAQWKRTLAHMRALDSGSGGDPDDKRPGYAQTLLNAQRAWLVYRDAHCTSEGYYARGGSMEGMLYNQCRAALTDERTEQLADLTKDDGQ